MREKIDLSSLDRISKEVEERLPPASKRILKALQKLRRKIASERS